MIGFDILLLLGFFIGTVLHAVLLVEIFHRQITQRHERVFAALLLVMTVFNGLQFLGFAIREVMGREYFWIFNELRYYSVIVLGFVPPLVVHVHTAFLDYVQDRRSIVRRWLPAVFYLPILVLMFFADYSIVDARSRVIDDNWSAIPAFVFWLVICLAVSLVYTVAIIRSTRNERWRQFFRVESGILVVIIALVVFFYFGGGTGNVRLDKTLKSLLRLTAILPTFALIFLLYKYPFYSIMARRRLLFVILGGSFFIVYLLSSRAARKWAEERPDINAETLDILLVVFLFILYEPVKFAIRRVAGYYALYQRSAYQRLVRRLTERIVSAPTVAEIVKVLQTSLRESLQVDAIGMFTLTTKESNTGRTYDIVHAYGDIRPLDADRVARKLKEKEGLYEAKRVNIVQLQAKEIPYQLYVGILLDAELVGVLCIGKKTTNESFSFEEKELLLTVTNQIAIAIENIELVQRRLELETRIFEADKLSALGLLATSIAHEVKNPLSSIKSIVQSMRDEKSRDHGPAEEIHDLEVINEEINRLTHVVDQLLRFAKPEKADTGSFDVCRTLDAILTILRPEARSRGVSVYHRFQTRPLWMRTSQTDLKEILFNVIINAIQAMPDGGRLLVRVEMAACEFAEVERSAQETGTVQVSDLLKPDPLDAGYLPWQAEPVVATPIHEVALQEALDVPDGNCVRICITDTGPGIPKDQLQDIFKPFFTTKHSGTGLGLAIVKSKIVALGGRLVLKSHEGLGTTFDMYIPIQKATA